MFTTAATPPPNALTWCARAPPPQARGLARAGGRGGGNGDAGGPALEAARRPVRRSTQTHPTPTQK